MVIKRAVIENAAEILSIQKLAFQSQAKIYNDYELPPLTQTLEEMQEDFDKKVILIAEIDGVIIGSVRGYIEDGTCHIGRLVVHPDFQNKGIGKRLMAEIEEVFSKAERFELFTGHRSEKSLYLYRKIGYEVFRERYIRANQTLVYLEKEGRIRRSQMSLFETDYLSIDLDNNGCITSIYDIANDMEYIAPGKRAPLFRLVSGDEIQIPKDMTYISETNALQLQYGSITAQIEVNVKPTHITFELKSLENAEVALVMWGEYPVTIDQTIGETIGVVQNDQFAFGIQTLNIHTIGGRPREYQDIGVGAETHAAVKTNFGSVVQAYTRNSDGGIIGSKIALFGCPAEDALETIGQIEVAEGLPHPMLDGEWGKTSTAAKLSYLITGFGEQNIDEIFEYAQKAGFKYIYHGGPFLNWGHFDLSNGDFPDGDESLKRCVEKASAVDIRVGVHTLSNFITTNDPYVSPTPDPRLMRIGSSNLTEAIDAKSRDIGIANPEPFREQQTLSAAIIGEEIIQYSRISEAEPWVLLGCKRGAFGTKASAHPTDSDIGKLVDHPYRVFFPNLDMQDEMAARLVELFNNTGLQQISFDGLEGCERTGHGIYAHDRFVKQCFDGWNLETINDASRLLHYLWHIHTRMNWGEPWGKATRDGMPEYRFKNQDYFNRNLFPRMLGWFQLRLASGDIEATSLNDMEWVLSKGAGFDAGFALSTSLTDLEKNGQTEAILTAISEWEQARLSGAFSADQREYLRNASGEFHLEPIGIGKWELYPVEFSQAFSYQAVERQPGEPIGSEWEFENKFAEQPLNFVLRVLPDIGASSEDVVINPSFQIDFHEVTFPVRLLPHQYLVCEGKKQAQVYDINWNLLQTVEAASDLPEILSGTQRVVFHCDEGTRHSVEVRFKTTGEPEVVGE